MFPLNLDSRNIWQHIFTFVVLANSAQLVLGVRATPVNESVYANYVDNHEPARLPHGKFLATFKNYGVLFMNMYTSFFKRQSSHAGETITVTQVDGCPPVNATASTTTTTGPNGSIFFLDCGISVLDPSHGGWTPPEILIDQLVINANFSSTQTADNSVLHPCVPYFDTFKNESDAIGVPPIMLAAFAMQESGCNPDATGSGGTAGLLQLSPDKCNNVNCYDPSTNIRIGAAYLQSLLGSNPNIVAAVGGWNGWYAGMTYADATSARHSDCYSQQNLDYLHQYFNGWLQNINAYGEPGVNDRLGFYFNLDVCGESGLPTFSTSDGRLRDLGSDGRLVLVTWMVLWTGLRLISLV